MTLLDLTDLVARLREAGRTGDLAYICREAADAIEKAVELLAEDVRLISESADTIQWLISDRVPACFDGCQRRIP